jgi:molybdate transport system ATP-binding protein
LITAAINTPIRVQIYARDVSITLDSPTNTSILNVLSANIIGLSDNHRGQMVVQLQIGKQILLAHITLKSSLILNLKIGMAVYAQIKGTSILN